jgi:hypothetical protein
LELTFAIKPIVTISAGREEFMPSHYQTEVATLPVWVFGALLGLE